MSKIREHFTTHDSMTQPGPFGSLYERLPVDVSLLRDIVSRLIVHVSCADQYGIPAGMSRPRETQSISARLQLIQRSFDGPLEALRPPHKRTFGTCRDYSLLLCSILRHRAIPARVRCGFATYFSSTPFQDHWVCEYWSTTGQRWRRVDAQIDEMQQRDLGIAFDLTDLPNDAYLTAAQAWKLVRSGGADPDDFGHGDARGLWFMNVNLHRDLLALANRHVSVWDTWRSATTGSKRLDDADMALGDQIAMSVERAEQSEDGFSRLGESIPLTKNPPWIDALSS
ncbi:transglutaminase-like domain-containing protein [Bradyrhizobium sp. 186]|uniref:transglutaminase-like domain-containing protein n=1 Tax=Bradyrhizobium sp. 186 TaxID=2782654 RepID=UPI002001098A|nr:transglutaminase-like domain-containing protein [Bradyrhizobium sp. 186]UPK34151.1 transglutaminase-like domain-containing protein [Bradyrhizobium sp. 186]